MADVNRREEKRSGPTFTNFVKRGKSARPPKGGSGPGKVLQAWKRGGLCSHNGKFFWKGPSGGKVRSPNTDQQEEKKGNPRLVQKLPSLLRGMAPSPGEGAKMREGKGQDCQRGRNRAGCGTNFLAREPLPRRGEKNIRTRGLKGQKRAAGKKGLPPSSL